MANEVITRFKLETTQFDSKLRDAAKGLQDVTRVALSGGKDFVNFSQKSVEAARALGTVASGATNAKDKVKDLVGAYNDAAKAYNKLSHEQQQSDFGKALAQSIGQLSGRIKEAKQELYGLGNAAEQIKGKAGGGLFGEGGLTGMLAVTGGNLLASGLTKLGSEMAETVKQSIDLAKAGEGVRLAFERLNQPGLLDNLKEATHGTVSELELMKAAVKFDDFKLPVEQLGTLLAFAQKKAKDTGQSVDYMVDSIVTGLGRKSLMILDNLGLSAAQIKEKMAETGDMTSAVAAIIKEQMSEAGEYVETAADRAARAAADASNQMEKLGREAMPVAEEWNKAWNSIKLGGMEVLTAVLGPIAESINDIQNILSGEFELKIKANIPNLADGPINTKNAKKPTWGDGLPYTAPGGYVEVTDANTGAVIGGQHFDNLNDTNSIKSWQKSLTKTTKPKSGNKTPKTEEQLNSAEIQKLTQEYIKASVERQAAIRAEIKVLQDRNREIQQLKDEAQGKNRKLTTTMPVGIMGPMADVETKMQSVNGILPTQQNPFEKYKKATIELISPLQQLENELKNLQAAQLKFGGMSSEVWQAYQVQIDATNKKIKSFKGEDLKNGAKESAKGFNEAAQAIGAVTSALNSLEDPGAKIMGIVGQAIAQIALGFAQATAASSGGGIFAWIAAITGGMATMISTIEAIHSATGYANGGEIKGNSYSGDNIPIMANAGEIILNKSQQATLASNLQGSDGGGYKPSYVSGEQIWIALNRYARRTGRGEIVTWK